MRVLIVACVLAMAGAVPSGLLAAPYGHGLAGPYGHGLAHGLVGHAAVAYAAPVVHAAPALPTISPGDLQGAAIDAHVDAADHARASVDAAREYHDQASELQGRAINAAEDHSWQAVDAVKTAEAQLDGAAAGVAPVLAKQLAGHVAPVVHGYAAPLAHSKTVVSQSLSQTHPGVAHAAYAAPVMAGAPLGYAAHGYAAHGYAAPAVAAHAYAPHLAHAW